MCTVTWRHQPGGYDIWFNRDELHSRAPERSPEIAVHEGRRYIAPRDGQEGGTWLLANDAGVTVCLLNDYNAAWRPASGSRRNSRGHIVSACAASMGEHDVIRILRHQPLTETAPFFLVVLSEQPRALVLHWTGGELARCVAAQPLPALSSSSFATAEVIAARLHRFRAEVGAPATAATADFQRFHEQHDAKAGAHSVLMHRPDASTRSIAHVAVGAAAISVAYQHVSWPQGKPVLSAPRLSHLLRCPPRTTADGTLPSRDAAKAHFS